MHYLSGDLVGAEKHFAAGLIFFDDARFRSSPANPDVAVFAYASLNAWLMGRADVAGERLAKMRAVVNPDNPHAVARSHEFAAQLHAFMRENVTAEALAARALELCEKHRVSHETATSQCWLGYVRAQLGRAEEGIALIRSGIAAADRAGNRLGVAFHMTRLAAAQLHGGAIDDALKTAEQALNLNPELGVWRPETLRIRGELQLKKGNRQLAQADFRGSIEMARSMGAKAWELRTTISLARLLDSERHRAEALTMVAEIYGWFREGFDTPDLKDAKALLNELAA